MKQRSKYIQRILLFSIVGIVICFVLFVFWKENTFEVSQNQEISNLDIKEVAGLFPRFEVKQDPLKIYEKENADLKERSLEYSPSGNKVAYYQHKFVTDIKEIGDPDYKSLILEQNGKKEIIFQGNFRLSTFEWLNNNEIKVYKGCGSSCLLSYVVNVQSKKYKESVEQIFHFE